MKKILVCLHTMPLLIDVFDRLGATMLKDVRLMHILDEPLLERVRQQGEMKPEDVQRIESHIRLARHIRAHAVLITCSTLSPGAAGVGAEEALPIIRIDEGMVISAVAKGKKIGVVATSETTLRPTLSMLEAQAGFQGKSVEIRMRYVEGALDRLLAGEGAVHDRLVSQAIRELSSDVDVIVLAQASMARVLDVIPESERIVEILSSPHIAMEQVGRLLSA
jgi:Asp/Glu/hydantoin racemase